MISLTRLSGSVFVLNSDLVERIDSTPDTVITLIDGKKYVVSESLPMVTATIRRFRAEVIALSSIVQVSDPLEEYLAAERAAKRPALCVVDEAAEPGRRPRTSTGPVTLAASKELPR